MMDELKELPRYYTDACKALNRNLLQAYRTDQEQTHHCIKRNGFIYDNKERFFSRGQVRDFIISTGEVVNADKATQNYFDRYNHEAITKKDLADFVESILAAIEIYLTNEACFGEVIDIVKPV